MKVRAKSWLYYGNIGRNPGEVFILRPFTDKRSGKPIQITAEMQFNAEIMEKVGDDVKVRRGAKPPKRSEAFPPKQEPTARDVNEPRDEEQEQDGFTDDDPRNENPSQTVI